MVSSVLCVPHRHIKTDCSVLLTLQNIFISNPSVALPLDHTVAICFKIWLPWKFFVVIQCVYSIVLNDGRSVLYTCFVQWKVNNVHKVWSYFYSFSCFFYRIIYYGFGNRWTSDFLHRCNLNIMTSTKRDNIFEELLTVNSWKVTREQAFATESSSSSDISWLHYTMAPS